MKTRIESFILAVALIAGVLSSPSVAHADTGGALRNFMDTATGASIDEGDGTYTMKLKDGRVLWLFSDSYAGDLSLGFQPYGTKFLHNQIVVQDSPTSETFREVWLHGANNDNFTRRATSHSAGCAAEWPSGSTQPTSSTVQIMLKCVDLTGTVKAVDLATLHITSGTTHWSATISQSINRKALVAGRCTRSVPGTIDFSQVAYYLPATNETYVYGVEACDHPWKNYAMLAKISGRDLRTTWSYYTGNPASPWSTSVHSPGALRRTDRKPIINVGTEMSVVWDATRSQWRMITSAYSLGPDILEYTANSPMGPWRAKPTKPPGNYRTPESGQLGYNTPACTKATYGAKEHPEFETPGGPAVISYNVNVYQGIDPCADPNTYEGTTGALNNYRPVFVNLKP